MFLTNGMLNTATVKPSLVRESLDRLPEFWRKAMCQQTGNVIYWNLIENTY